MIRTVHPIEQESFEILRSLVDLSHFESCSRAVVERVIHASADLDYASEMILDESSVRAGIAAIREGATIVTDVEMVSAGITAQQARCFLTDPRVAEVAAEHSLTRSAAAIRLAAREVGPGAVWVVGCAPTALYELLREPPDPAVIIGLPVGFVGAAESKQELAASGLPAVTNRGRKGGSAVAAAAVNAMIYYEESI